MIKFVIEAVASTFVGLVILTGIGLLIFSWVLCHSNDNDDNESE